jgi:hypothetical protein
LGSVAEAMRPADGRRDTSGERPSPNNYGSALIAGPIQLTLTIGSAGSEQDVQLIGENGRLPDGIHPATLEELEGQFGTNHHRKKLVQELRRLLRLAGKFRFVTEIYIDGSFVTNKPDPEDMDIILGLVGLTEPPNPLEVRDRTRRVRALRRCAVGRLHVFPYHLEDAGLADMTDYFCSVRPEDGGGRKGIVRLVGWNYD